MINLFFSILIIVTFYSISVYSYYYKKKDIIYLVFLTLIPLIFIRFDWRFSILSIFLFLIPVFVKKTAYTDLTLCCMYGSILFAYFLLNYFLTYDIPYLLPITIGSVFLICVLAIVGIFEVDLKRFLIISNLIQTIFVVLDLSVAKLAGKIAALGTIQIFNYTIVGLLFFITLGILSLDDKIKNISKLFGSYYKDRLSSISAIIAALSLAGIPGLNMFVSEWLLFITSYEINPVITIFGIFAALLLFVMYFKIVNIVLTGRAEPFKNPIKILDYFTVILAITSILFGLLPQLQLYILGMVI